ncbi:MAG: hypothetical protein ACLGJC_23290 [Alphaproteobacteria bacterium]
MTSYQAEFAAANAEYAAKFAVVRFVIGALLFAAVAGIANMNTPAVLAADEVRAAAALEMVRTMPVTVADAAN